MNSEKTKKKEDGEVSNDEDEQIFESLSSKIDIEANKKSKDSEIRDNQSLKLKNNPSSPRRF